MSWDVILMSVPSEIVTGDEFPHDFSSELGPRSQILSTIASILPDLDLTDPIWGILDGDDYSIEFNIGDDDPVKTIMLHVRGGDNSIRAIQLLCDQTGWRAFDTTTGDFIRFIEDPTEGLHQWRNYRNQVVASLESDSDEVNLDAKIDDIRINAIEFTETKKKKWWHFWE